MNRPTLFLALSFPVVVCAGLAVIGNRRINELETSLARAQESITRLEAEARRAANFRVVTDALNNPPPGLNQVLLPAPPPLAAGRAVPAGPIPSPPAALMAGKSAPTVASQQTVAQFLEEAKITAKQWEAVQKANTEARTAAASLARELADDVDPAVAEAKMKQIEDRQQRIVGDNLAPPQRQAYEQYREAAEIESIVSLAGGRVRRLFRKY